MSSSLSTNLPQHKSVIFYCFKNHSLDELEKSIETQIKNACIGCGCFKQESKKLYKNDLLQIAAELRIFDAIAGENTDKTVLKFSISIQPKKIGEYCSYKLGKITNLGKNIVLSLQDDQEKWLLAVNRLKVLGGYTSFQAENIMRSYLPKDNDQPAKKIAAAQENEILDLSPEIFETQKNQIQILPIPKHVFFDSVLTPADAGKISVERIDLGFNSAVTSITSFGDHTFIGKRKSNGIYYNRKTRQSFFLKSALKSM